MADRRFRLFVTDLGPGLGFGVQGVGLRGLGFRVEDCGLWASGFRI